MIQLGQTLTTLRLSSFAKIFQQRSDLLSTRHVIRCTISGLDQIQGATFKNLTCPEWLWRSQQNEKVIGWTLAGLFHEPVALARNLGWYIHLTEYAVHSSIFIPTLSQSGGTMWHFFLHFKFIATHRGMRHLAGGRNGPYAPYALRQSSGVSYVRGQDKTDINAVFSIETRGSISTSCSEAISSSSCGVTEVLSDCGRAIRDRWYVAARIARWMN